MSLFDTIIGRQQLQSLPPEQQDQARRTARSEFILNSLFGGRGLASGFEAARGVVPSMQAAQQRQLMAGALESSMVPTGIMPGSQLDMLNQQLGAPGDQSQIIDDTGRTAAGLQRVAGGTGMQGTGLTAQQQLLRQFDPSLFAQNVSSVMDPSNPQAILDLASSAAPVFDAGTGTSRDPFFGQVTSSIPVEGKQPGVVRQYDTNTNRLMFRAGAGAREAAEEARPIDLVAGEVVIGRDFQGNPIVRNAQGVIEARLERDTATALGQAAGQVEPVYDPSLQRKQLVPRTAVVGGLGSGAGAGASGGLPAGPSVQEEVLTRSQGNAFEARVKTVNEKGQDAAQRAFQATQLYNTASDIDPTALTAIGAAIVPYVRAIPGFRDATDQFATNTALLGQQYARGVLGNFSMVKGNLNAQEVRLVEDASWQKWDPRTATRYIAALEAAFADKDAALMEFTNTYQGDFRQFDAEWRQSAENKSAFNHPLMTRFVNDEVREAQARGVPPNLPPGFKAEESQSTGAIRITKPDGSIMMMG